MTTSMWIAMLIGAWAPCGAVPSSAQDEHGAATAQSVQISIAPILPKSITKMRCLAGHSEYNVPEGRVYDIIRRTLEKGELYEGRFAPSRPKSFREWTDFHLDIEGPDRSFFVRIHKTPKVMMYHGPAKVKLVRVNSVDEAREVKRVQIRYRIVDSDHAELMEIARVAHDPDWHPSRNTVVETQGTQPARIETHPFLPQDIGEIRIRGGPGGCQSALPHKPMIDIVARTVTEGELFPRFLKGLVIGGLVADGSDGRFTCQLFEHPKYLNYWHRGVEFLFLMSDRDHAELMRMIDEACDKP